MITKDVSDLLTAIDRYTEGVIDYTTNYDKGLLSILEYRTALLSMKRSFDNGAASLFLIDKPRLREYGYQDFCEFGIDFGKFCHKKFIFQEIDPYENLSSLMSDFLDYLDNDENVDGSSS